MATFAPCPANRIAVARPIPLPAPVMKATLPVSLDIDPSSSTAKFANGLTPQLPRRRVLEHDTALAQCRDLLRRIAAAGEDFVAVLAEGRGRSWRRSRCPAEFDRFLHCAIPPYHRMIEGCDEIFAEHLRVVEHVLDWAHRRARHALPKKLLPFECGARSERGAQFGDELSGMSGPAAHRRASWVICQLRPANQSA